MPRIIKQRDETIFKLESTNKKFHRSGNWNTLKFSENFQCVAGNLQKYSEKLMACRKVTINVSGQRFTTWEQTLNVFPDTLLGSSARWKFYDEEKQEFFFDRDPYIFRYILNYYRSRNLHTSPQDCPLAFKAELDFFGISFYDIDECCSEFNGCAETSNKPTHRFASRRTSKAHVLRIASEDENQVRSGNYRTESELVTNTCKVANGHVANEEEHLLVKTKLRTASCKFSEGSGRKRCTYPKGEHVELLRHDSSKPSIVCHKNEVKGYIHFEKVNFLFRSIYGLFIFASVASTTVETVDCAEGIKCERAHPQLFFILDSSFVAVFTLELLVRFFISNQKMAFVKNIMNIIDFLAIVPYYVDLAVSLLVGTTEILITLRILRVCRILKLTRNSLRLQSLIATLKNCFSDLVFLYFTLTLAIVLFASCLYYMEKDKNPKGFESIPHSFWYTCVTMITTG